uniref:Uncharacterized protein n=1 Tax=Sphaerodactylus townsendi TaxID=933632 RepID=A0ACB8G034_9SAUR
MSFLSQSHEELRWVLRLLQQQLIDLWLAPGQPPVVSSYMRMMRDEFETNVEQVYEVGAPLEGEDATWLTGLSEDNSLSRRETKEAFEKLNI